MTIERDPSRNDPIEGSADAEASPPQGGADYQGLVKPKPSATVVLVREAGTGPELLLLQRPDRGFAPGSWVFPGGVLDSSDYRLVAPASPHLERLAGRMGLHDAGTAYAYVSGAVRETWEETGLLVGGKAPEGETAARLREAVLAGTLSFAEGASRLGFVPHIESLTYIARWVTPSSFPRRYDTRFFVARSHPDDEPSLLAEEIIDHRWLTPREAIDRHEAGELSMLPPTAHTIRGLDGFSSVADMLDFHQRAPVVEYPPPPAGAHSRHRTRS